MADTVPVKANFTAGNATSLGEFQAGDTTPIAHGGTGANTAAAARTNIGLGNVDNTSDINKPVSTLQAAADTAALNAAKAYAETLVVGLWDDRGNFDASVNAFPSSGGSGVGGAILKGDIWTTSVAGTLGGVPVTTRQSIRATVDSPGQVLSNWAIGLANTDLDDSITAGVTGRAPSQSAVFNALAALSSVYLGINAAAASVVNGVYTVGDQTIAGIKTFSSNPILSAGTANGVPYLNASKVLTTGTALSFNGTNLTTTGAVGIGSTALTARGLVVGSTLSGSVNSDAIASIPTFSSGVTGYANGFTTAISTQEAAFTVTNMRHYVATQGTFGAGSTVTTQAGFHAETNLTGATNNYGFRGQIPADTGRYNLYMDGTAPNYLAGNLSLGAVTASEILEATGRIVTRRGISGSASTGGSLWLTTGTSGATTRGAGIEAFSSTIGNDHGLRFYTNATTSAPALAATLSNTGLFGLGSAGDATYSKSGVSDLSVAKATTWATISARAYANSSPSGGLFVLGKSRSATVGALAETLANDTLGYITAEGVNVSSANRWAAAILFQQDGTAGLTYVPGRIILQTGTAAADVAEKFCLANDGTTTIGGISTAPAFKVNPTASQVNWPAATGAATGQPALLSAEGETNVNLKLIGKGTGKIDIGSPVVLTAQTVGSTVGAAGGATALPATPLGYLTTSINGTACKVPYYNV